MAGLGLQAEFERVKNVFRRKARATGEFTGTLFVEWDNHDDKRYSSVRNWTTSEEFFSRN